jgi:uncharacterized membrane protein
MLQLAKPIAIGATVFAGAIFGFFYAWVCSTMWGLDALDPRTAISAMNGMNGSVRNAVFAPAFFGTPFVLALAGGMLVCLDQRKAGQWFFASAVTYLLSGLVLTMVINVPMNEALALVDIPIERAEAQLIWDSYSGSWQIWNQLRTLGSGVALVMACVGLTKIA